MAPSTKNTRPGADAALAAEAAEEKYVTFTATIGGEELELTVVRDPMKLPRRATRYMGRQDPDSVSTLTEILLGAEQLAKVDALDPSIEEFMDITVAWSEAAGIQGK
ncbi:hypothetical protein [Ancrocorticia populi]|uniref:hypothetical protein n=1 Tax=Ancrocorticia populi TaxID=2175228 RepID=UPI003F9AEBB9